MSPTRALLGVLFLGVALLPGRAQGVQPGSESKKRKELLEKLGLEKKKKAKKPRDQDDDEPVEDEPSEPSSEEQPGESSGETQPPAGGAESEGGGGEAEASRRTFSGRVHRALRSRCAKCHKDGGSAGSTGLVLSGNVSTDYRSARKFVKPGAPSGSPLLSKGAGKGHMGGSPLKPGTGDYKLVRQWIADGAARGGGGSSPPPAPAPVPTQPSSQPSAQDRPPASASDRGSARDQKGPSTRPPAATPGSDAAAGPTTETAPRDQPSATAQFASAHEVLMAQCSACHAQTAMAGSTRFALTGDIQTDLGSAITLVERGEPSSSLLLTKGEGQAHGGGAAAPAGSAGHETIADWIRQLGTQTGPAAPVQATDAEGTRIDATTGASPKAEGTSRLGDGTPVPAAQAGSGPFPVGLPFNLRINGKFDFSYERRNFKNHPFGEGDNAFQTYHHFLFLSRSGAKDPFGFNIELMTQQFYEFNARFSAFDDLVRFLFKAGKIMVPFGPEPLFHKSYGGRTGFDQQVLPVVWAQPGIAVNVQGTAGPVQISNDLYAVQGYALRSEDAILNLQGDFSGVDNFKVGLGDRLGLSVAPVSAWYSFQFNTLGFDRLLFMQALDVEFWRWHGVPVLRNLVVGLGGMRADVSGGDEGDDYYHFGSYGWIGYYPIRWLYLQYRAGLRTIDNRRGLYFDEGRIDERDGSSHNVTVTGRYKGFYASVQWFWNLEKANEQDDDFMRFTVGYEF